MSTSDVNPQLLFPGLRNEIERAVDEYLAKRRTMTLTIVGAAVASLSIVFGTASVLVAWAVQIQARMRDRSRLELR